MAEKYLIIDDEKTCKDFNMYMTEKKIKAIGDIAISELDVGSRNGVKPIKTKVGKNKIALTFECFNKSSNVYDDIRDFVNYLSPLKGERKLVFSDEKQVYRYAVLTGSNDIDFFYAQYLTFGKFELSFTMYNPYTYSSKIKKFYYNGKNGATAKLINNGGDSCPLKIKVYAPKGIDVTKYEDTNSNIIYDGEWGNYSLPYFSGGTSKYASGTGSSATFEFYGTGIKLYGLKSAGKGLANIYIDNVLVKQVDCYAESEQWSEVLFSKIDLPNATHTIKVEVSGQKSEKSVGYQINIDYFEVFSSSIPSDVKPLEIKGSTYSYEIIPSISNVEITIGKESIKYTSTINPTDELIIDTDEYEMELNQMNCLRYWENDFPQLNVGENLIKVTDKDGSGALVIFEYRERWF